MKPMTKEEEQVLFGRALTKEEEKKLERNAPIYRVHQHEEDELIRAMKRYQLEASFQGGPILHHSEVFERRGWMLPFLKSYDELFWGRWDYWGEIVLNGTIEGSGPIPQIHWCTEPQTLNQVKKMFHQCLDYVRHDGGTIDHFADWLLWALGIGEHPPKISAKTNEHWYRTFDLGMVLKHPTDYFSRVLEEESGRGVQAALGYFSTPFHLTQMMTDMVFSSRNPEETKHERFYEPCVGCGAMMLPASNYCLFGAAQDINPVAVKLCKVQMFWYAPWFAVNPFA